MKRLLLLWLVVPVVLGGAVQQPASPEPQATSPDNKDEGIPVTSDLVKQKCASCHKADDKGRLTRISYRRATPEGWEETIKRMVSLNTVRLEPAEARDIVRYLADHHGLAPEEAKAAAFEVERRLIEYSYPGDKDTERTCSTCHSMGRVLAQRRTKEEWTLLLEMHRAIYPGTDTVFRRGLGQRRGGAPQPGAPPEDTRHPMDRAIEHLSSTFPLTTAEWAAWAAALRTTQLQGRRGAAE